MNNKCKFCGYRFKDKDEQICPECLTAREDDISCGIFGEDEHSHERFDADNFYDGRVVKSDTFKDGKADFLKEERREENRAAAAKYERRNGGDINVEATPAPRLSINTQSYNYGNQISAVNKTNSPKKKSSGKGCAVFIIILIMLGMFGDRIPELIDKIKEEINSTNNSSSQVSKNTKEPEIQGIKGSKSIDCDFDIYLESFDISSMTYDEMTIFQKPNIFYSDNDNWIPVEESDQHDLKSMKMTFVFEYPDHKKVESEDVEIKDIYSFGYNADNEATSLYTGSINDTNIVSIKRTVLSPTMFFDAGSESGYIVIDLDYKGKEVTFTFPVELIE